MLVGGRKDSTTQEQNISFPLNSLKKYLPLLNFFGYASVLRHYCGEKFAEVYVDIIQLIIIMYNFNYDEVAMFPIFWLLYLQLINIIFDSDLVWRIQLMIIKG